MLLRSIESAGGELVAANARIGDPGELPRKPVFVLHFLRIDVHAVASAVRTASGQGLRRGRPTWGKACWRYRRRW